MQLTVRESRHGPVLSDAQKSHGEVLDTTKFILALRWGALDADNHTVLSGLRSNAAQPIEGIMARNDADGCGVATCAGQSSAALNRALTRLQKDYGEGATQ